MWADYVGPLVARPNRVQAGALCYRTGPEGTREVLLIKSLRKKRWIIPKGWPMADHDMQGAAVTEAWEEAGVRPGAASPEAIGSYTYRKALKGGARVLCDVQVFAVEVSEQVDDFPEAGRRILKWMSPAEAAAKVKERGLADILRSFGSRPDSFS
jgi:8-oxo-dGTP pyrophosphatase MutT (NUDIX family)